VLEVVARHGARTVFGLPGVHNLAFWRTGGQPAPVVVRHEQAAVYGRRRLGPRHRHARCRRA
jgi:acetolactate synthase-1/2/3 large subunit